ncbi:hypothetical protein P7D22_09730 [Lichenihabitans sp. Uapishka_5]|uniref:hypothetical protein n=1 Tax=Lichenihabitans sp. Uapishka_5 TaxID=3037302 RepID=UPI0029E827FF|nr:hypothetical protein [Lichenihabitans sp. Uapishka_5]MDX7951448.1 hypothetical protein [Lichenihabitans sp. Uapishka_5]
MFADQPPQVSIAAFRSGITSAIGMATGFPVAVLAVTEDPERHARRLTASQHGAWVTGPEGHPTPFQLGSHSPADLAYSVVRMDGGWMGGCALPPGVSLRDGVLRVALPPGATVRDLDQLFGLAMYDVRFDSVARLPTEVRRRHRSGRAREPGSRYSRATGSSRFALVNDVYRFRRRDLAQVAGCAALALDGLIVRSRLDRGGTPIARGCDLAR